MDELRDTIVAPITPPGHGGVAVVRVSGALCREILSQLVERADYIQDHPREMVFSSISDLLVEGTATSAAALDHGLVTLFPGAASYTGEECLEFSIHGSPFLVERLIENILTLGARMARPGEFTERAFHCGKLDLSQAEAVADLIAAETELQATAAREQLEGKLSRAITELGDPLRDTLAELEAHIDFPEEDISNVSSEKWQRSVLEALAVIQGYLQSFQTGRLYREGARIAILGLPNAGKSSLLNKIVGEERAIVTPIAGTTRDVIEERVSLDGLFVRFFDTAGLVDAEDSMRTPDEVELLGIERSWKSAELADIVLYVFDSTEDFNHDVAFLGQLGNGPREIILVANKADLLTKTQLQQKLAVPQNCTSLVPVVVSAQTGAGVRELMRKIRDFLVNEVQSRPSILVTTQRHAEALQDAEVALRDVVQGLSEKRDAALISIDLRRSLNSLNEIIGVTSTEDILGRIFSKFCIGK